MKKIDNLLFPIEYLLGYVLLGKEVPPEQRVELICKEIKKLKNVTIDTVSNDEEIEEEIK